MEKIKLNERMMNSVSKAGYRGIAVMLLFVAIAFALYTAFEPVSIGIAFLLVLASLIAGSRVLDSFVKEAVSQERNGQDVVEGPDIHGRIPIFLVVEFLFVAGTMFVYNHYISIPGMSLLQALISGGVFAALVTHSTYRAMTRPLESNLEKK